MKFVFRVVSVTTAASGLCLSSCASIDAMGKNSVAALQKTSSAATSKVAEFSQRSLAKIRPTGVKVVEVREKDLKELPTGEERALAFEKSRRRNFWVFGGPVDFEEPSLPQAGMEMDGSLLPPKMP